MRATASVALMMQGEFSAARDLLQSVCKELEDAPLPSWLPHQAVAATAWANHAAAILGEGKVADHSETVSLLDASLKKLPRYAALYHQLASCLLLKRQFPMAMSALHCALCISPRTHQ